MKKALSKRGLKLILSNNREIYKSEKHGEKIKSSVFLFILPQRFVNFYANSGIYLSTFGEKITDEKNICFQFDSFLFFGFTGFRSNFENR